MARGSADERRDARIRLLGRPILLIFWSFVLWGTLYGLVLIHGAATEGPSATLRRTLSGQDAPAGLANLALACIAALVWAGAGIAFALYRLKGKAGRVGDVKDEV